MSFRLPPPAQSPREKQNAPTNAEDLSMQEVLTASVGELFGIVRGIDNPDIEEFFTLITQVDFSLDEERAQTVITESSNAFVRDIRDAVVEEERSKLQFSGLVSITDESAPNGKRAEPINPEEKQKFIEVLDNALEINVSVENHAKDKSAEVIATDILSVVLLEPLTNVQAFLSSYIKKHSMKNPLSGNHMLVFNRSQAHPSELRSALRSLGEVNNILKAYIDDPYEFIAVHGSKRDPGLGERTKEVFKTIIEEEFVACFAQIIAEREVKRKAQKIGSTALLVNDLVVDDQTRVSKRSRELVFSYGGSEKEVLKDHTIEITDLGEHIAQSPLKDAEPKSAKVTKVVYGGKTMLVVYAYDEKLKSISSASRAKYNKSNGKLHPYDTAVHSVAEQLLNGGSVESLGSKTLMYIHKNHRSEPYQDIVLAGKKVGSANDSKVYFTFGSASEVLEGSVFGDMECIVVLAETDKANQMTTLMRINGSKASVVKSKRAGIG